MQGAVGPVHIEQRQRREAHAQRVAGLGDGGLGAVDEGADRAGDILHLEGGAVKAYADEGLYHRDVEGRHGVEGHVGALEVIVVDHVVEGRDGDVGDELGDRAALQDVVADAGADDGEAGEGEAAQREVRVDDGQGYGSPHQRDAESVHVGVVEDAVIVVGLGLHRGGYAHVEPADNAAEVFDEGREARFGLDLGGAYIGIEVGERVRFGGNGENAGR